MTKKSLFIGTLLLALTACDEDASKQDQIIHFDNIPTQISIAEEALPLTAISSSGLFVTFTSSNENIAVIESSQAVFRQPGVVSITASQSGNEHFYEAPNIVQTFEILSVDPTKKDQIINFDLISAWKSSKGNIELNATASSGLPIKYISSDETVGFISINYLVPEHYYEYKNETAYTKTIAITASQAGNSEYNPAANVTKLIDITVDVAH
ncbi:MAG: hypothetical protein LBN11_01590 [Tannerella sp.]|jgi:uncharacterized protein (DUF1919 family)|nr:hypothetical protein [Tannerella sp.]